VRVQMTLKLSAIGVSRLFQGEFAWRFVKG
jgi:hypothetical protein